MVEGVQQGPVLVGTFFSAPPLPRSPPGPRRPPPVLGSGLWRAPARPPVGEAWCCGLCKARRRVGVRPRTRATGARRTWGPTGARGSTGGQRPRGPRGRVRGAVCPRCAGAKHPLPCFCAGPRDVRARGTRPPGSTARTCWCPSALQRIPCRIPRRAGRCLGGGRAVTRGQDGGARGCPTAGEGGPELQQAGADAAPVVPAQRLLPNLLPRVVGENPVVVEGGDEVIPRRAGVPPGGGVAIYVWLSVRWGTRAPNWHSSAASRWRRASRLPSATASHPTRSPSPLSSSWRSAAARSVGSMRSRGPRMSPSRDTALS